MTGDNTPQYDGVGIWGGGAVSGIVAGVVMGVIMHFGANLIEVLGGLVPGPDPALGIGWVVHMAISVAFALVFAGVVSRPSIRESVIDFTDFLVAGLIFGALIGIIAGGVVFPVAMQGAGVAALPVPFLPIPGVAGEFAAAVIFAIAHLAYGLTLAAAFATINGVTPTRVSDRIATLE